MLKIIMTSDNLYLPLFHDMMVVDLVHLMNHNVVHIYHNYKDFNSFSVLSPENEISDIFISFYFTKVFPNKKIGNFDRQCKCLQTKHVINSDQPLKQTFLV